MEQLRLERNESEQLHSDMFTEHNQLESDLFALQSAVKSRM